MPKPTSPIMPHWRAPSATPSRSSARLAEIVLYCWKLPPTICIRDIVVAPTRSGF
jgi:hypothetical protein